MKDLEVFFKSALTVDNVIFGFDEAELKILLIKRGEEPYSDEWALPGHFVYPFGRVITTAYFSLIKIADYKLQAAGIAKKAKWLPNQTCA